MLFLDGYFDCSRVKFRARARRSDRTILRTLPQRRLLVRGGCRRSLAESPTHRDLAGLLFVGNLSCVTCANRRATPWRNRIVRLAAEGCRPYTAKHRSTG